MYFLKDPWIRQTGKGMKKLTVCIKGPKNKDGQGRTDGGGRKNLEFSRSRSSRLKLSVAPKHSPLPQTLSVAIDSVWLDTSVASSRHRGSRGEEKDKPRPEDPRTPPREREPPTRPHRTLPQTQHPRGL